MEYLLLMIICLPLVCLGIWTIVHAALAQNVSGKSKKRMTFQNPFKPSMEPHLEKHHTIDADSRQNGKAAPTHSHTRPSDDNFDPASLYH